MKIRNTAEIVKEILEQKPRARDCDFVLYGFVLTKAEAKVFYGCDSELTRPPQSWMYIEDLGEEE